MKKKKLLKKNFKLIANIAEQSIHLEAEKYRANIAENQLVSLKQAFRDLQNDFADYRQAHPVEVSLIDEPANPPHPPFNYDPDNSVPS